MDEFEVLHISRACERLSYDYARWIDLGQAARAASLFTDDAVLTLSSGPLAGTDEISAFFEKRQGAAVVSRHVITNVVVDVLNDHEARGTAYLTFYREPADGDGPVKLNGPLFVGHYEDDYALTSDGWRFRRRTSVVAFQS
jgi:hypothetical protein